MAYQIEVTDTFGGEANYCWVNRYKLDKEYPTDLKLIRAAKRKAGWTGHPCTTTKMGDDITVRPHGVCQIMFITWIDD